MLNRSISVKVLLRIAGAFFLLVALYFAFRIATIPVEAHYPDGTIWRGTMIENSVTETLLTIVYARGPYGGFLMYVGVGVLLLGLSSGKVKLAYWCLQAAVWFVGLSLWYQQSGE